jgi:folate-binding protein YgfZ
VRIGIGGPLASAAVSAVGTVPMVHHSVAIEGGSLAALPGSRFIAFVKPPAAPALWDRLATRARPAGSGVWQWLTIRAGLPLITAATQDQFVPQMANLDALGGISFNKGCYTGQEIVARTQYLGRLKERLYLGHVDVAAPIVPGTRLHSVAFDAQPCGTVLAAAPAPEGGSDLLAVLQISAADGGDVRLGATDGPAFAIERLPYPLPAASAPRGRIA